MTAIVLTAGRSSGRRQSFAGVGRPGVCCLDFNLKISFKRFNQIIKLDLIIIIVLITIIF